MWTTKTTRQNTNWFFRPGKSIIDQIFTLRQILENIIKHKSTHTIFLSTISTAFDSPIKDHVFAANVWARYTCKADKAMQNNVEQFLQLYQGRNGPFRTFWYLARFQTRRECITTASFFEKVSICICYQQYVYFWYSQGIYWLWLRSYHQKWCQSRAETQDSIVSCMSSSTT